VQSAYGQFKDDIAVTTTFEQEFEATTDTTEELCGDEALDITRETCPMTFVRTRLALDRMAPGRTLLLRLTGEEPRRNVPRTATEQGHQVLAQRDQADGTTLLLLRKKG
jgi:TusA-related sulfurtransferase